MLIQPTLQKMGAMKLSGMVESFEHQLQSSHYAELSFEERVGLMVDTELEGAREPQACMPPRLKR